MDVWIAIPTIIPITRSTLNPEIQSIFETIKTSLFGLQIKSYLSSITTNSNSKLFWGFTIISDKICVNFATRVIEVIELSANKFECVKMNKYYFTISYFPPYCIIIIIFF